MSAGSKKSLDDSAQDFDFCHHCKQLKNKFVLAQCNYNSEKIGPTVPALYCVKDVKIYNSKFQYWLKLVVDMGNKASVNYLIK
jgi:hypothetical protein